MFCLSYKCRMCGEIIIGEPININRDDATKLINKTIAMEEYMNGLTGNKKMVGIHNCKDGSVGISDFQGMKVSE